MMIPRTEKVIATTQKTALSLTIDPYCLGLLTQTFSSSLQVQRVKDVLQLNWRCHELSAF